MSGITYFFYGTLCHAPLLQVVMGRVPGARPARLPGHAVHWAEGQSFPIIVPRPGAVAEGLVVQDISAEEAARLDYYEGGFDHAGREVAVQTVGGPLAARVFLPGHDWRPAAPWDLADWVGRWGDVVTEAAREFMALRGTRSPEEVLARYPQMLVRAASRLRAAPGGPVTVRRRTAPGDIALERWRQPYAAYFAVEEMDLRFRRFDGAMSAPVRRAVFISGDAATVLPYDPRRDRVLLIEQFRAGPFARGDAQPWLLEAIAGRIDPGESPEQAARREAREEAGLALGALIPVGSYYPSPAAKGEYLYSFLGLAELPDALHGAVSGVAAEHEDIRTHLLPFDALMALVERGEAENGPLLLSALALARRRERLRAEA